MTSSVSRFQRAIICLCLVLMSSLLPVCQANEAVAAVKLGILSRRFNQPDFDYRKYGKFYAYLRQKLSEQDIEMAPLAIAQNIQEMEDAIRDDTVNLLMEGLVPTLIFSVNTKLIEPALIVWRKGQREYHSVFFVRRDSGISSIDDLPGHAIAFESPRSTSAFHVPLAVLQQHGIKTTPIISRKAPASVQYIFADSELNQAYWVLRGKVDAAAFSDGDWQRLPETIRKDLKIVYRTRPMLRWLLSYRTDMPPDIKDAIIGILLQMHEDPPGIEALQKAHRIARFEKLNENDLANLEYWKKVLNQ